MMLLRVVDNGKSTALYVDDYFVREGCSTSYLKGVTDGLSLARTRYQVEDYFWRGDNYPHRFDKMSGAKRV